MKAFARALAALLLVIVSVSATGCIHTWTETYADFPPSAWDPPHSKPQGNPSDG
jgi:hypothetical protein